MGQQQLLLIVLGIVVIGIAIAVGIFLFRDNAISSKRDLLAQECIHLGQMAMEYYRKPVNFGGGGRKFTGWGIPTSLQISENGNFSADVEEQILVITGTGNEVITGTDSIKIQVTVYPQGYQANILK